MMPMGNKTCIFKHFRELNPKFLDCDMHIHTLYTDGKSSIGELIARAETNGLNMIAFTEHVRADSKWFSAFADEVRELGDKSWVTVLVGAEARIINNDGELDISDSIRGECDIILGSVHRFTDAAGGYRPFSEVPASEFPGLEFDLALGYLRHGRGDVLAHPGGMSNKFGHGFPDELQRILMRESSNRGIAIELNSKYILDMKGFCILAAEENPLISIGSDAHDLFELGSCGKLLKELI
ncbi:MAG: PHP domain-containing protein [Geobacteraceae bacterium]